MNQDDLWNWHPLDMEEQKNDYGDPVEFLHQRFARDHNPGQIWDEFSLARSRNFARRVIWLEHVTIQEWPRWRGFLQRYADASRGQKESERGLVCIFVKGLAQMQLPKRDVALNVHVWRGVVSEADMFMWSFQLVRNLESATLERRVRGSVIASLAGSDPELAQALSSVELSDLFRPVQWLQNFARQRKWEPWNASIPEWHTGAIDDIDGQKCIHSAIVALGKEADHELTSRVWQGQLNILFPLLERQRVLLLQKFDALLRVPHKIRRDGRVVATVEEKRELEFTHILDQLRTQTNPKTKDLLRRLRNARNAIAHLELISVEELRALIRLISP